jgi:hypothetical protein
MTLVVTLTGLACLAGHEVLAAPQRTFDRVTYTAPDGWKVEETNRGFVSVSRAGSAHYCLIAIYEARPAGADLEASFAAAWDGVALLTLDSGVAAPTSTRGDVGGGRAALGATAATIKGSPAAAILIVLDAGPSVVPILILSPTTETFAAYEADVKQLLASLVVQRAPKNGGGGGLAVPPPARALTVADLAGEWKKEDRVSTLYVDRDTGAHAGHDSLAFRDTWTIGKTGSMTIDFFAVRNGKKIVDKQVGAVRISTAGVIDISIGAAPKYLVRGWLEMPGMTVLRIVGPFYGEVPADVLASPTKGANMNQDYVRLNR